MNEIWIVMYQTKLNPTGLPAGMDNRWEWRVQRFHKKSIAHGLYGVMIKRSEDNKVLYRNITIAQEVIYHEPSFDDAGYSGLPSMS